jgi:hypothetical protein
VEARRCVCHILAKLWGPFHPTAVSCYADLLRREGSRNSLHSLRNLIVQGERLLGQDDRRLLRIRYAYGAALHDQALYSEAVEILEGVLSAFRKTSDCGFEANTLGLLAKSYYQVGDIHTAELRIRNRYMNPSANPRQSILLTRRSIQLSQLITKIRYSSDPNILGLKANLLAWLLEWGRNSEAEILKREIDSGLGNDDLEVKTADTCGV